LWDTFKGICLKTIVLEKSPSISNASFLPDMKHLLISTLNNQIQVTDLYREEEVTKFQGHLNSNFLLDTKFMEIEDEIYLLSGSEDFAFYVWEVSDNSNILNNSNSNYFKKEVPVKNLNCLTSNSEGLICVSGFPESNNIFLMKLEK
jgi:WD40 repeat protein